MEPAAGRTALVGGALLGLDLSDRQLEVAKRRGIGGAAFGGAGPAELCRKRAPDLHIGSLASGNAVRSAALQVAIDHPTITCHAPANPARRAFRPELQWLIPDKTLASLGARRHSEVVKLRHFRNSPLHCLPLWNPANGSARACGLRSTCEVRHF